MMNWSIIPILLVLVFGLLIWQTIHNHRTQRTTTRQSIAMATLIISLLIWGYAVIDANRFGLQNSLLWVANFPILWQACVPVVIITVSLLVSKHLRSALSTIATHTPASFLILIHGLRVAAAGGISKGLTGEINSNFVFWVGIPDFIFGASAFLIAYLSYNKKISNSALIIWNLVGALIILIPTFLFMPYFASQVGFTFIFESPMILAPSLIVPIFVVLNLGIAWHLMKNDYRYHPRAAI